MDNAKMPSLRDKIEAQAKESGVKVVSKTKKVLNKVLGKSKKKK